MCGLAGITFSIADDRYHQEMTHLLAAMHHRGPDSSAFDVVGDGVMLGSNRLRITDAHNTDADMPMVSASGRYTIVYNGEVYNHQVLRRELSDYPFRTHSDTETILAAFEKWGRDALSRFEGMFAFALYDHVNKETLLAVDPSGQKFIYYLRDANGFVFASEILPIITDTQRTKTWDKESLREYVAQRMILGRDTHITEIKKLEAGTYAVIASDQSMHIERYYTVPIGDQNRKDVPSIVADIRAAIMDGCYETFNLEVPYGHLLSGGIDSTGVLALAKKKNLDLKTYSIGFNYFEGNNFDIPSTFNEFEYSRFASSHLETDHTEIAIKPEDYIRLIDRWIDMCGEPLDSSEAPMLISLFQNAAHDGLRVVFCGSGPDEAFDGYGLGKSLGDVKAHDISAAYYDRFNWTFSVDLDRLMPGAKTRDRVIQKFDDMLAPYRDQVTDPMQLAQLINLHGRCVGYEYRQMDVISMHHSVEVRSPLADTRLTRTAFDFDPSLKQHQGEDKWIYKQAFRGLLPDKIVDRKKVGFPTPIELWFTQDYQDAVRNTFQPGSALFSLGIIDEDYAREIWNTGLPEYRCIDYRLYILNRLISNQKQYISEE